MARIKTDSGWHSIISGMVPGMVRLSLMMIAIVAIPVSSWGQETVPADHASVAEGTTPQAATAARRPNIIFVFSDDHAIDAIGAYGSTRNQTPQLDRLAREGMIFDRAFCGNSICGPSRATVLTGLHSHLNGYRRNGDRFDGQQTTFPQLLQQAGYRTALFGKWHLQSDPTGFDQWEILPDQGSYYNPDFLLPGGQRKRMAGYCTDLITDRALQWLDERRADQAPFLLCVWHKAPHRNWSPPPRHFGRYPLGSIAEPATLRDDWSGRSKTLPENEMTIDRHFYAGHDLKLKGDPGYPRHFLPGLKNGEYERMDAVQRADWDAHYEAENAALLEKLADGTMKEEEILAWKYQRYMHDYLGTVQGLDDNVGRVLDWLEQTGLAGETIVVYSSDQGFYLGEHGWYDKRWMFEESLRMPLIVRWPGVTRAGSRSQALVQNIDFAPTLLEAAGVPVPAPIQGQSLVPLLRQPEQVPEGWRDAIHYQYHENDSTHAVPVHDGIRTDRYKLVRFPRTREWNLFDLQKDPQELHSLHADPEYAAVFASLKQRHRELGQALQYNPAVIPTTRGDEPWWKAQQREVLQQARDRPPRVIFLGDSITQGWRDGGREIFENVYAGLPTLNMGFSGDRTEHALWRLQQMDWSQHQPETAVIMIGTNNTGQWQQDPQETAAGVERIVQQLRQDSPRTRILLFGLFPRGETSQDPLRLINRAVNERICRLDDGKQVFYRELWDPFLLPDGAIRRDLMPDALHLSPSGYQVWNLAIQEFLQTSPASPQPQDRRP